MRALVRLNAWLGAGARVSVGALLLATTGLVFVNVALRYAFGYAISWAEEVTKYCLLWFVFLGSGVAAREVGHVSMEAFILLLSRSGRRLNAFGVNLVSALLSAFVGLLGWRFVLTMGALDQRGPASGLPVYWVYLAVPVGCLMMGLGFWEAALRSLRDEGAGPQSSLPLES